MAIKADDEIDRVESALGIGGNVEVVPILVPISTYQLLLQAGKERGMSVSDVIARSIELFLQPKQDITNSTEHKSVEVNKKTVNFIRQRK